MLHIFHCFFTMLNVLFMLNRPCFAFKEERSKSGVSSVLFLFLHEFSTDLRVLKYYAV